MSKQDSDNIIAFRNVRNVPDEVRYRLPSGTVFYVAKTFEGIVDMKLEEVAEFAATLETEKNDEDEKQTMLDLEESSTG